MTQTKLLIPGLRPFYTWAEPLSWALVRITAGLMIIPHGWPKLMAGVGPVAANALAKRWGLIMLAIALRGGGPYSLDRKLGREL
jgi:uncharacterized membrane protein YphA (DoxX/SURF4 family)